MLERSKEEMTVCVCVFVRKTVCECVYEKEREMV